MASRALKAADGPSPARKARARNTDNCGRQSQPLGPRPWTACGQELSGSTPAVGSCEYPRGKEPSHSGTCCTHGSKANLATSSCSLTQTALNIFELIQKFLPFRMGQSKNDTGTDVSSGMLDPNSILGIISPYHSDSFLNDFTLSILFLQAQQPCKNAGPVAQDPSPGLDSVSILTKQHCLLSLFATSFLFVTHSSASSQSYLFHFLMMPWRGVLPSQGVNATLLSPFCQQPEGWEHWDRRTVSPGHCHPGLGQHITLRWYPVSLW